MAQKLDFTIPFNDLTQYVPQNLRNPVIKGLIDNLFNRFMTHDESVPLYGYVGRKPSSVDDRTPLIPESTVERDINSIIPVLNFKLGTQTYAFTVQDLINKARAIGITSNGLQWLYSQSNNYLPPINIDKFANFFNYFWIAKAEQAVPDMPWNRELLPEYYTIAKPLDDDLTKLNVVAATTQSVILTGTGFNDQSFTITFTSPLTFTIKADNTLGSYHTLNGADPAWPNGYTVTLPAATVEQQYSQDVTFGVTDGTNTVNLLTFKLVRDPIYDSSGTWVGNEDFAAGDKFFIDTNFLSLNYNVVFAGGPGVKGKIQGVTAYSTYQTIDGVQIGAGQRVLVKNNTSIENGIYVVGPQSWTRASDYDGANITPGAKVWVAGGSINGGKLFTSGLGNSWSTGVTAISNTNDWQEGNFWIHGTDLGKLNLTRSDVIQAVRPIIEYSSSLRLNGNVTNGVPSEGPGGFFKQTKYEFNQLPLFDLYRYDGTHAGLVSSIFFYVEDLTATLDIDLQKRVKISSTDSADYIFNHGLIDANGDLLFYKTGTTLKTIWHPGYTDSAVVDESFVGMAKGSITSLVPTTISVPQNWTLVATSSSLFTITGSVTGPLATQLSVGVPYSDSQFNMTITNGTIPFAAGEGFTFSIGAGPTVTTPVFTGPHKGQLTAITAAPYTQQQVWTIRAVTSTLFTVHGSKTDFVPPPFNTAAIGVPYTNADLSFTITAGALPFNIDDTFLIRIGNLETPRYVYRNADAAIYDLYGGPAADIGGVGAFQVPRPFINNPYNESNAEVLEGTLYAHFRGILQNQFVDTKPDYAFGGSIKNWSEQQTLLASLLMQRDMTPISMIDLAQREYENGLNSVADIFKQEVAQYFTTVGVVDPDGTAAEAANLNKLLDYILEKRSHDNDVRTVLFDTTSAVIGIPATLPQLGILPLVQPSISFNNTLGRTLMTHHDGHNSVLYVDDLEFRRAILNNSADIQVLRSDGTKTAAIGSFTNVEPALPYKGELWIRPNGGASEMLAFDVDSDAVNPPVTTTIGFTWYDRGSNVLNVFDGVHYVAQPSHSIQWRVINLADTLNQLTLLIEQRLYNGINPNARKVDFTPLMSDPEFKSQLMRELFTYAANNGLSPLGSDYIASNAFSWNYSSASTTNFPTLTTMSVPARWYNILKSHQSAVPNVQFTDRPNIEPWKLLNYSDYTTWWSSLSSSQQIAYTPYKNFSDLPTMTNGGTVRAISTLAGVTPLNGLQVIDGVALIAGDRVILSAETSSENNGVYIASAGAWIRDTTALIQDKYFTVSGGYINANTIWAIKNPVVNINVDPVNFGQVRLWTNALWADIKAVRPTLRLSVDTMRDTVLPPYVNPTLAQAVNALTGVVPSGVANTYQFGEGGPVETVWLTSLEFGYSLARSLFRHDPLLFLGFCWGFNWVEVDGILYDSYDINTPGHKRFRLHGDLNRVVERGAENVITGTGSFTILYDAYEVTGTGRYQNFSVRDASGIAVGYVREGVPAAVAGLSISIDDLGRPFHIGDKFEVSASGTVTFVPAVNYKYLGFGQIFTNALRDATIDTTDSFAIDAFRGWDVNMGHRAGGLVATDDLKVRTDNDTLSTSSFDLLFKKNAIARDMWVQALRITVSQFGAVNTKPDGLLTPKSDGSDWVFLIEGYNPRFLNISYFDLLTNGTFQTFNVLDQKATTTTWKEFTQHITHTDTFLPLTITGIQNVVNFLFGYNKFLDASGWVFNQNPANNIDAETGRARTFQLEVEMFIDRCYRGIQLEQGHIVNPFMDQIWVRQDTGLLSEFTDTALFDITGNAGVFDIAGIKFKSEDVYTIRGNQMSQFGATAPMYSAHAQIDEFEHLFVFNYFVENSIQNGLLYDPFSGARVVTYKFNGRRQATATFRPEFGGHYLVGDSVRQNLQASTDNITNFFDPNHAFENETTTRHALALLGFNTKTYFDNLDISDKSQFNFWRGLIQSKGTNLSIDAYLNNNRFTDAKIDEYWAYKIATYGDARQHSYPELKLNVDDSLQQFTQLQFDAITPLDNFTQINRFDEARWFSIDDLDHDAYFKAEVLGSFYLPNAIAGTNYTLPFVADKLIGTNFTSLNATTVTATVTGPMAVAGYGPATPRYNPIKLFNYVSNELVKEIPLWHPAISQHTPTALESINVISNQNPAKYNFSTQVANNNTYDPLRPWGSNELGRVWFDTRNLSYIPYSDETIFPNRPERLSRWGTLADFSTIDVYEWVQSTVPPSKYNALAALQAGDADLDPATKAAGEVALQESYVRDRIWGIRPIAWSYSSVPTDTDWGGQPPFDVAVTDAILSFYEGKVSLFFNTEYNTFAKVGIVPGMRIGGWDGKSIPPKPLSEYIVNNTFTKQITMGGNSPVPFDTLYSTSTLLAGVDVTPTTAYTSTAGLLVFVPIIETTQRSGTDGLFVDEWDISVQLKLISEEATEVIELGNFLGVNTNAANYHGASVVLNTSDVLTYVFPITGVVVTVIVSAGGTFVVDQLALAISTALGSQVGVRDAVTVTAVVPNSFDILPHSDEITNDPDTLVTDFILGGGNFGHGWRAWSVPTQAELKADGRQPVASWRPYVGDFTVDTSFRLEQIADAVAYAKAPLTLNNGVIVQRYQTTWADWNVLKNTVLTATQVSTGQLQLLNGTTNIDAASTSVYVNGIAQLAAAYSITANTVTLSSVPTGSIATVIIRPYQPSAAELAFDPTVADDLSFQQQYKQDYEYVSLPVRDSEGALSSTIYYFWVKNKSINALSKKLSVSAIAQELRDGPPNFLTFQNLIGAGTTADPYRYDAITISGLSYIVAKDNTFKLRFTRNFTLRDDPQQLDLKDTHTEWSLLRPSQRTRIPEALWNKLTDSLAGQNAAGSAVPALRRELYDERNGTSTRFGFEAEQTLAPQGLLVSSVIYTIVNTKLINKSVPPNADGTYPADFIEFLNPAQADTWFATPAQARQTMTDIWNAAKPAQINEIFFAALNDILASNYELADIFKTSRLSAYSIKVVGAAPITPTYE